MSSEISTDVHQIPAPSGRGDADAGLQPWQLFTLAGLIGAAAVAFFASAHPTSVRLALILTVFGAAAVGLAALRVLAPLTGHAQAAPPVVLGGRTRAALERDKALLLRSLKELEFDHAMGKVSEKDFSEMSARLRGRAARILRQLDAGSGYRAEIEREIERRVGSAAPARLAESVLHDDQAPAPPHGAAAAAVRTCACGTDNDPDARFCKACGARLEAA
jgi:hypothetical protein